MIGFACSENTNAMDAFAAIQDKIVIAKDLLELSPKIMLADPVAI